MLSVNEIVDVVLRTESAQHVAYRFTKEGRGCLKFRNRCIITMQLEYNSPGY
jgi:hypothetical protein